MLEALQVRTQQSLEKAFGNELDRIDEMARKVYFENYYHSIFKVQKGFGIGWEIGQIDQGKLDRIVTRPWTTDGRTFSDRIWSQKSQMIGDLHKELTRACAMGDSPNKAAKRLEKYVDGKVSNAKNAARRLVMTEQAFFHSESERDAYKELGCEQYEILATLDSHTSEICQDMDGEVFDVKDFEPGATAPPFHVYCRSVTVPHYEDDYDVVGERAARDEETGRTYYVPANMKYPEWKEAFVSNSISKQTKELFEKYISVLGNDFITIEEFAKIKYNDDEWRLFKSYASSVKSGELTPLADFDLYKRIGQEMDDKLLGATTSNGLTITGKSNHSIARVIGSIEQRRSGVQVSDILDALTNAESEVLPIKTFKNGRSQKFRNKTVEVSVNPDAGNIIQVNPVHRRKKVKS